MILTGKEIIKEVSCGNISIRPFDIKQVNPNSYNYRISETIKIFKRMKGSRPVFEEVNIPQKGIILKPCQLYLACTSEVIGSKMYDMALIGRSSLGRLGLFLQLSANLGHTTSERQWTLELVAAHKIRIYPSMIIGQVSFWENKGDVTVYDGNYGKSNDIQESLLH
ncbi:MAG: deoxycytidine deaminase [bacterium]